MIIKLLLTALLYLLSFSIFAIDIKIATSYEMKVIKNNEDDSIGNIRLSISATTIDAYSRFVQDAKSVLRAPLNDSCNSGWNKSPTIIIGGLKMAASASIKDAKMLNNPGYSKLNIKKTNKAEYIAQYEMTRLRCKVDDRNICLIKNPYPFRGCATKERQYRLKTHTDKDRVPRTYRIIPKLYKKLGKVDIVINRPQVSTITKKLDSIDKTIMQQINNFGFNHIDTSSALSSENEMVFNWQYDSVSLPLSLARFLVSACDSEESIKKCLDIIKGSL